MKNDLQDLLIYKQIFVVIKDLHPRIAKFEKQYKYTLGNKIMDQAINSATLIFEIAHSHDNQIRSKKVNDLIIKLHLVTFLVRIANELNQFKKTESYLYVSENIVNVLMQAEGWKKYILAKK